LDGTVVHASVVESFVTHREEIKPIILEILLDANIDVDGTVVRADNLGSLVVRRVTREMGVEQRSGGLRKLLVGYSCARPCAALLGKNTEKQCNVIAVTRQTAVA
jgi:hypothetical protein